MNLMKVNIEKGKLENWAKGIAKAVEKDLYILLTSKVKPPTKEKQ